MSLENETGAWRGEGVTIDEIASELARLHAEHQAHEHAHAAARTLNLLVTPVPGEGEAEVVAEIERLGSHSPARAIVLRDHEHDRVDAEAVLDCDVRTGAGEVGICHDRVLLSADYARLEHSDSMTAALLVPELPTVAWVPHPGSAHAEAVARRADHLLVDTAAAGGDLGHAAALRGLGPVNDLTWGRLERWRGAVADAWEPEDRRRLLPDLSDAEVHHGAEAEAEALLLAGWISARAGLDPDRISHIVAEGESEVVALVFRAGGREVRVERPLHPPGATEEFGRALIPGPGFRAGYAEALEVAAVMQSS